MKKKIVRSMGTAAALALVAGVLWNCAPGKTAQVQNPISLENVVTCESTEETAIEAEDYDEVWPQSRYQGTGSGEITLEVTNEKVTGDTGQILLSVTNHADADTSYGVFHSVEKRRGGNWYLWPYWRPDVGVNEIAIVLPGNSTIQESLDLDHYYTRRLTPGTYRVLMDDTAAAEFTVELEGYHTVEYDYGYDNHTRTLWVKDGICLAGPPIPKRDGWEFTGWYPALADGETNPLSSVGESVSKGRVDPWDFSAEKVKKDLVLLAEWKPEKSFGTVTELTREKMTSDAVTMSWTKEPGAAGYVLYIYECHPREYPVGEEEYLERIVLEGEDSTSYTDSNAPQKEYRYYRVCAYKESYGKTAYHTPSNVICGAVRPKAPKITSAKAVNGGIRIEIAPPKGLDYCYTYCYSKVNRWKVKDKDYLIHKRTVGEHTDTIEDLEPATYYVRVRPYTLMNLDWNPQGVIPHYGDWSDVAEVIVP